MIPIEVSAATTTRFGRKAWVEISKDAWSAAGAHWHERILPRHFDLSAKTTYGYAPRTAAYMRDKARRKGHQNPLVWKGDLQRSVLRMRDVSTVRARGGDEGSVNVRLSGPRYLHQRQQPGQPNLALELSQISARDAQELGVVIDEFVTAGLEADGEPRELGKDQP